MPQPDLVQTVTDFRQTRRASWTVSFFHFSLQKQPPKLKKTGRRAATGSRLHKRALLLRNESRLARTPGFWYDLHLLPVARMTKQDDTINGA